MIICEVGLNHLGSEKYSLEYVTELCKTDCDAITYQIREKSFYKGEFSDYTLSDSHYQEIIKICKKNNKLFGFALADKSKIDWCVNLGADLFKVLSWGISDYKFVKELLDTDIPVSVSTGLSTQKQIEDFAKNVTGASLIHTQLTNKIEDTNLMAISRMKTTGLNVGYGNHSSNLNCLYVSTAFEPNNIWFYVKGAKEPHPDDAHAVPLSLVQEYVSNIKDMIAAVGTGEKTEIDTTPWNEGLKDIL